MIDFWKKDIYLLLPFKEYEPIARNDDEEPKENLRKVV
jgi:hypothetical protein